MYSGVLRAVPPRGAERRLGERGHRALHAQPQHGRAGERQAYGRRQNYHLELTILST